MKAIKNITLLAGICFIIYSCNNSNDKTDLAVNDISHKIYQLQNQGWKSKSITHFVNDIQYKATEVPREYYLLKHQGAGNLKLVDSISTSNNTERIIEFEFEHINNEDLLESEYTSRSYKKSVSYMASTIKNDFIAITSSNDTIPCLGVHFERNFKVAPYKKVLLYFGNVDPNETIQLLYKDQLFGNGLFKFTLNETPFKS